MPVRHFQPGDVPDDMNAELRENGVLIIDRRIGNAAMNTFMAEAKPAPDDTPTGGGEFFGGAMKRVHGLASRVLSVGDIITDPLPTRLGDAVLLEDCRAYRVQVLVILEVWQGGKIPPLHRDVGVYGPFLMREPGGKEILLSWIVAATDFTEANGATRVVPGSHIWPSDRVATENETEIAVMPRGSALIYLGSVLHGARVNTTATPRTGIVSGYAVGWLRREGTGISPVRPSRRSTCRSRRRSS